MSDSARDAFYRVLSAPLRRLCGELQDAASAYGFLDSDRTARRFPDPGGRQDHACQPGTPESPGGVPSWDNPSSAVFSGVRFSSASSPKNAKPIFPMGGSWQLDSWWWTTLVAVAMICLHGVERTLLFMPAIITLGMTFLWALAWGVLQLTFRRSSRRLSRLLADMHFQQRIAREAVRWVHELEVTFKALCVAPTPPQQTAADASGAATRAADSERREDRQPQQSLGGPPCSGASSCWESASKAPTNFSNFRRFPKARDLPTGMLRLRLCQVLEWQEDLLNLIYENIMRPKPDVQFPWRERTVQPTVPSLISRGPWKSRDKEFSGNDSFDGSVGALRDRTTRSWAAQSRLSARIQVFLRRLLFSLGIRLHWRRAAERRSRSIDPGTLQRPPASSGEPHRRPSRALRLALLTLQQPQSSSTLSLGEEVAQATSQRSDAGIEASAPPTPSVELLQGSSLSSTDHDQTSQYVQAIPARSVTSAKQRPVPRGSRRVMAASDLFRNVLKAFLEGCFVVGAAVDGISTAWWLISELLRLHKSICFAGQLVEATAKALLTLLEEEWVSCPVSLPEPRWVCGVVRQQRWQHDTGKAEEDAVDLMPCTGSPPPGAFVPFSSLPGTVAPVRRIALASMSRHIAASLALLRLPVRSCCCNGDRSHEASECVRRKGARSPRRSNPASTDFVEGSAEASDRHKPTMAEGQANSETSELSGILGLTLQHLRVALEEGERLQQSLRLAGKTVRIVGASSSPAAPPDASVEASEGDKVLNVLNELPQVCIAEPVRCLEIYTAVGEDCISYKHKFQEEAAILAAFADEDPAVRERSQITLRELEIRLQGQQLELQNLPRVLKELSAVATVTTEGSGDDSPTTDGVVCIVATESLASEQTCDADVCSTYKHPDGVEATDVRSSHPPAPEAQSKEDSAAVVLSETAQSGGEGSDTGKRMIVFSSSQEIDGTFVCDTNNVPETWSNSEGDSEWLDSESLAFRLRQQRIRRGPTGNLWQSSEAVASQNLLSELQVVLTKQRQSCSEGPGLGRHVGATPGSNVGAAPLLDICTNCGPTAFGDDSADEEEWDSCGVVEGPNCSTEAPVWVAAPLAPGDGNTSTKDKPQKSVAEQRPNPE